MVVSLNEFANSTPHSANNTCKSNCDALPTPIIKKDNTGHNLLPIEISPTSVVYESDKNLANRYRSNSIGSSFSTLREKTSSDDIVDLLERFINHRVQDNASFFNDCKQFLDKCVESLSITPPQNELFSKHEQVPSQTEKGFE